MNAVSLFVENQLINFSLQKTLLFSCALLTMVESSEDVGATNVNAALHVEYILSLETKTKNADLLYFTDHKRLSGVYWALTSLHLLHKEHLLPAERILPYVKSCYREEEGSYGGNSDQDGHLLYTLSALQILALYDALDSIDTTQTSAWVASLQQADGSFAGDRWGETDSRFSYCALLCLRLLGRLDLVDVDAAVQYVVRCVNFDGAFGCIPGAESHAGQVFCCVGALSLTNSLHRIDKDLLGWWLCERQLPCGGFNGRPDKREDVCYSWWVLASLAIIGKKDWIDADKLATFIEKCQDPEEGGIADRPGDMPDVFHTFFGLAGLSLLGRADLEKIDPTFALPVTLVKKLDET